MSNGVYLKMASIKKLEHQVIIFGDWFVVFFCLNPFLYTILVVMPLN
jgi:hypothetical protein